MIDTKFYFGRMMVLSVRHCCFGLSWCVFDANESQQEVTYGHRQNGKCQQQENIGNGHDGSLTVTQI